MSDVNQLCQELKQEVDSLAQVAADPEQLKQKLQDVKDKLDELLEEAESA